MFACTVMAHTGRYRQARQLAETLHAALVVDDGTLGATGNAVRAWESSAAAGQEWSVVVEDDAIPVPNIRGEIERCLPRAPTKVGLLYLGTSRPYGKQNAIKNCLLGDPAWIISDTMLNHVAVFMRTELVPSAIDWLQANRVQSGPDSKLTLWSHHIREPISVAYPSLFDHYDGPQMVQDRAIPIPAGEVRKAYKHGSRDNWDGPTVVLDRATHNRYRNMP